MISWGKKRKEKKKETFKHLLLSFLVIDENVIALERCQFAEV